MVDAQLHEAVSFVLETTAFLWVCHGNPKGHRHFGASNLKKDTPMEIWAGQPENQYNRITEEASLTRNDSQWAVLFSTTKRMDAADGNQEQAIKYIRASDPGSPIVNDIQTTAECF